MKEIEKRLVAHAAISGAYPFRLFRLSSSAETSDSITAASHGGHALLWLNTGEHWPASADLFPFTDWRVFERKYSQHAMQMAMNVRHYGQLVGSELHALGVAVLQCSPYMPDGSLRFSDDAEVNADMLAAFWSGLRIQGVAMAVELAGDEAADWEQAIPTLTSGAYFVLAPAHLATPATLTELLGEQRFSGVACAVASHADDVPRFLADGWHLVLPPADASFAAADMPDIDADEDALKRIDKRVHLLKAVEDRGKGFVHIDRDSEYRIQRRVLGHKFDVADPYVDAVQQVRTGTLVAFNYVLRDEAGEVLDTSSKDGMQVIIGKGSIVRGLEHALLGHVDGDHFTAVVAAEDAYGAYDPELEVEVGKGDLLLPPGRKLAEGLTLTVMRGPGDAMQARVVAIGDDKVKLNGNHPLAGKPLHFEIKITKVV